MCQFFTGSVQIVKLETRVGIYPGLLFAPLRPTPSGTRPAISVGMQQLALSAEQVALLDDVETVGDADTLMPLTEAKRLAAAEFERRYLVRVMARAAGSVSEGARLSGLDRTNFRRLLQRHGLR